MFVLRFGRQRAPRSGSRWRRLLFRGSSRRVRGCRPRAAVARFAYDGSADLPRHQLFYWERRWRTAFSVSLASSTRPKTPKLIAAAGRFVRMAFANAADESIATTSIRPYTRLAVKPAEPGTSR